MQLTRTSVVGSGVNRLPCVGVFQRAVLEGGPAPAAPDLSPALRECRESLQAHTAAREAERRAVREAGTVRDARDDRDEETPSRQVSAARLMA